MNNGNEQSNKNADPVGAVTGFFLFRNFINNYNEIKQNGDRTNCKRYGVHSAILSLLGLVLATGGIVGLRFGLINMAGFTYGILFFVAIFTGVIIPLIFGIYAFVFAVMQVRLNRKAIGIIALILSVFCILGGLLAIAIIFV